MKNTFTKQSYAPVRRGKVASGLSLAAILTALTFGLWNCSGSGLFSGGKLDIKSKTTPIPISILYRPSQTQTLNLETGTGDEGLGLVSTATNLFVSVSGCASGYTVGSGASPTAITSGVVNLYKGDYTCLVKLEKFTLGSVTYSSQGTSAVAFNTYAAGGYATFQDVANTGNASSNPEWLIKVFVAQQVSSPLLTSDSIVYNFTDIAAGATNTISQANVSTPVPLSATGKPAPNFTVAHARYLTTNSNGSGALSFSLACAGTSSGSGTSQTCDGVNLTTQLDYIFKKDTYSQGAITVADANTAFGANTPTPITDDGTDGGSAGGGSTASVTGRTIPVAGSDTLCAFSPYTHNNTIANGGFCTQENPPLVTGTVPVYTNGSLNNIFILRMRDTTGAQNTLSYLYFYVNIAAITQN